MTLHQNNLLAETVLIDKKLLHSKVYKEIVEIYLIFDVDGQIIGLNIHSGIQLIQTVTL